MRLNKHDARETLIALLIAGFLLSLFYSAEFSARDDSIKNCEQRNEAFKAMVEQGNQRSDVINSEIHFYHPVQRKQDRFHVPAYNPPLADCEVTFRKPWPFG